MQIFNYKEQIHLVVHLYQEVIRIFKLIRWIHIGQTYQSMKEKKLIKLSISTLETWYLRQETSEEVKSSEDPITTKELSVQTYNEYWCSLT